MQIRTLKNKKTQKRAFEIFYDHNNMNYNDVIINIRKVILLYNEHITNKKLLYINILIYNIIEVN